MDEGDLMGGEPGAFAMDGPTRKRLQAALIKAGQDCREFGYYPGRFLQDAARSDPMDLCRRYVLGPPTDGFTRLMQERRLDLSVESVVWRFRRHLPADLVDAARQRLREVGFDVHTQKQM